MAQFYQLTSLEELCRLYPNIQVGNSDSVQYMVQDDKIIQYTDAQGQILTAVEQSGIQLTHNPPAASQSGVFVLESVETQQLDTSKPTVCVDQPQICKKIVVQQINSSNEPSNQMVANQQPLILQQLDPSSTESFVYKEISSSENKSQFILQMDQSKSQNVSQQSQFVIHPVQANEVQADSSKQESNSPHINYHNEVTKELQECSAKVIERKELQKLPVRRFEGNKVECQTIVENFNIPNNHQQTINMHKQLEPSNQKAVVGIGKPVRHFIMQQVDKLKQQGFIFQHLEKNSQLPNPVLIQQFRNNDKSEQTVIQNLEITNKDSQAVKLQNLDNTHIIMQKCDGNKQQGQYQTQHFIVPQGEKLQSKVVLQRLEVNKQIPSTPQLIVQQLQTTSSQTPQFVVHQFDRSTNIHPSQRSSQQLIQQSRISNAVRVIDSCMTSKEEFERSQSNPNTQQQQTQCLTGEKLEADKCSKRTQDIALQSEDRCYGMSTLMPSPVVEAHLRKVTLKQNMSEVTTGLLLVPKAETHMPVQYESGVRIHGSQQYSHVIIKQRECENKSSNDKISQTRDVPQNTIPQESVRSTVPEELQKSSTSSEAMVGSSNGRDVRLHTFGPLSNDITTHTVVPQLSEEMNFKTGRGRGRGTKGTVPYIRTQNFAHMRTVQTQATEVCSPKAETLCVERKSKDFKGNVDSGITGWIHPAQDIRNAGQRPIVYHLSHASDPNSSSNDCGIANSSGNSNSSNSNTSCNNNNNNNNNNNINATSTAPTTCTTNNNSSNNYNNNIAHNNKENTNNEVQGIASQCPENSEDFRLLVLLPNGERKTLHIPNLQQNLQLNQLCQQVRFSLGSQFSVVPAEQVMEKTGSGQLLLKCVAVENQESQTVQGCNSTQFIACTNSVLNQSGINAPVLASIQQQRPRGGSPRLINNALGNNVIRSKMQCNSPQMPAPRMMTHAVISPTQPALSQNVTNNSNSNTNITLSNNSVVKTISQEQEIKENIQSSHLLSREEPKYVAGFMAICPFCGISSIDFNKCIRCRRKLPENVKSQSIFTVKKKRPEKTTFVQDVPAGLKVNLEDKQIDIQNELSKDKPSSPLGDKKKIKSSPKKKKVVDEPAEILILSSDDEEDINKRVDLPNESSALCKEPTYQTMALSADEIMSAMKGTNLVDDLMENIQPGSYTTFNCRVLRVGSYKVTPKERICMSSKGIKFIIPSLKCETATIIIPSSEILKILIHFGKQLPVLFIYASPKIGIRIRTQLCMENKLGPYYDPTDMQEETHKRITLLLEKMTEDNKVALYNMFGQNKLLEELSEKEANEILVRASPAEDQGNITLRPADTIRKIMIYPPPPEKGGIALNNQDYACLGEDQFLNDVIIDFYLKYLLLKVLSPQDRERTHVFSTFFYKRLTTKPKTLRKNDPENDPKLSPAEKRHMRVKGWTKQVNLFEKDFIIVPINEHSHWFLAIICFPGLSGPVKFSDNTPVELEAIQPKKSSHSVQIGNTTITHIMKSERNSISVEMDPGSDRDEAEGDQDDIHQSSEDEETEQTEDESAPTTTVEIPLLSSAPQTPPGNSKESKSKPVRRKSFKEPIKQPCILIFDSLAGASRVRVVATLRDYLKIEYRKKMGQDKEFTKDTIKGAVPKVPQQNNFTDCGLYVLQYVESFFQDPLHDFKLPLKYLQDWFPEEVVSSKRQELALLIRSLMEEQGIKVDEIGLPALTFTSSSNTGEKQAKIDEGEDEEDEMNEEEEEDEEEDDEVDDEEELKRAVITGYVNDEELELDEEENEEGEDEEYEEDTFEEELDLDEMQKFGLHMNSPCSSELESEGCGISPIKSCLAVAYDPSGSDEECFTKQIDVKSGVSKSFSQFPMEDEKASDCGEEESLHRRKKQNVKVNDHRKNVPLTEFQDFESQITCTTIEKNVENTASESDMAISDGEDEDTSVKVTNTDNIIVSPNSVKKLERRAVNYREKVEKDKKAMEVNNIINKLVNDKSITVRRKEDWPCTKKQIINKRMGMHCDRNDENKSNLYGSQNAASNPCIKRAFEALKSVRIPKKTDRTSSLNKRQKVDET